MFAVPVWPTFFQCNFVEKKPSLLLPHFYDNNSARKLFNIIIAYFGRRVSGKPDSEVGVSETNHEANLFTGNPRTVSESFTFDDL